ncbi:phosphoribosyl-ATP pyrophosphatase [Legionella norrlandica]|uniref:Histidine biosynthesis bifunctional protein HisIE n=1 Tax=Legionella norrlandica TaxID=1498499 RepID=A0A0A2SUV5_9GAMM|nr:bifunctional phosphoribosyl-AMP cyclohydrolase/phosphoribosyl-ATP diphosphatase HisIE [Legionella norrlandica]KGP63516.1 phosphoribosyl-ATP pyrophosphatase [Legionella norrlandica]
MKDLDINSLDWKKMDGLLPAIIQNAENGKVLMLGYMNQEALIATLTTGQLTLYSRSRQRLWRKGESSGNSMALQHISTDCDNDSLLIQVIPKGPACHLGYSTCYQPQHNHTLGFLDGLIELINERAEEKNNNSYTVQLLDSGIDRCAQKLGEEAVETVIAAVNNKKDEFINESADLIYHLLVLLKACELSFYDVLLCLQERDRSVHT